MLKRMILIRFLFLAILSFVMGAVNSEASENVDSIALTIIYDEPVPYTNGHGKSNPNMPNVIQNGYELSFLNYYNSGMLYIVEEEVPVYVTEISLFTASVILPYWLSGDYKLLLYPKNCNFHFCGFVNLFNE